VNPSPIPIGGFTSGGTYTSTSGLSINASTGVVNLAASTPGTYTVTYSVAASGCSAAGSSSATISITPSVTPVTGFSYSTPVCAIASNPIPVGSSGFSPGGTYSSGAGLSINPATGVINLAASVPGTYLVTYTIAASGCNPAGSSSTSITITAPLNPITSFSYTSPVCINGVNPVPTGVAGFTSGGTYTSTPGLSINSNSGIINLSASSQGTYTVTYSVPAQGCTLAGSSTTTITINPLPAPPMVSPVAYCVNAITVPLTAVGNGLLWYTTSAGGTGTSTSPRPSASSAGATTFYVSQTVGGCESQRSPIAVTINPLPFADAGSDKQIFAGESVTLNGFSSGNNVTVLWSPVLNMVNETTNTPVVAPLATTTYTLTVTSADGCTAFDQVQVVVLQDLVVPNVFSPNGDGINDKWIIKFIEQYPGSQVQIFNRYGQLLKEIKGYNSSNAWDGTNNGKPLPVGAYYYIIRLFNGREPLSGSISIIR
jgi:gliding motility-associated-like protein